MCGIAGFELRGADGPGTARILGDALGSRGPDASWALERPPYGLVQTRLAIIDLSDRVDYPMSNEQGNVWLLFNGEVYDHRALFRELSSLGHHFTTNCDAEVVLHGYEEWGIDVFRRLNGMFAIALLDERSGELVLARDPLGVKPLVRTTAPPFAFGSDATSLVRAGLSAGEVDEQAVAEYALFHYVPPPATGIRGVVQVEPGTAVVRRANGSVRTERWAEPPFSAPATQAESAESLDRLDAALSRAVSRQLVADVPVGVLLSSGVDSSLVMAYAVAAGARPRAFTIAFPGHGDYDEGAGAAALAHACGVPHEVEPFACSFVEAVEGVAEAFDQPFADASAIAALQLARLARRQITVALTGTGGDELFGGYYRHRAHRLHRVVGLLPPALLRRLSEVDPRRGEERQTRLSLARSHATRLARAAGGDDDRQYLELVGSCTSPAGLAALRLPLDFEASLAEVGRRHGLGDDGRGMSTLRRLQHFDLSAYLAGDLLAKDDRSSMAVGLEVRVPLLDLEVVALAARLPDRQKATLLRGKIALRELGKRHLPGLRHGKRGFTVPLGALLNGPWRDECAAWLRASESELVSPERVAGLLAGGRNALDVWALCSLIAWERRLARARATG